MLYKLFLYSFVYLIYLCMFYIWPTGIIENFVPETTDPALVGHFEE